MKSLKSDRKKNENPRKKYTSQLFKHLKVMDVTSSLTEA